MTPAEGDFEDGLVRLPPGRHGFSREFVANSQRERLLNAVVEVVAERGYNGATIARIVTDASVSRRAFYEHFSGKEECFAAAYEIVSSHLRDSMLAAAEPHEEWPSRLRAALAALLRAFAADPALARFWLIEPLAAGGEIADRYRASMKALAAILRPEPADEPPLGSSAQAREQALVGGLTTLIVRRLNAGEAESLPDLLPDLLELTLTPYLGRDEARRLAEPSAPQHQAASPPLPEARA
jgi:AcrR family transcriptional regulator